MSRKRSRNIGWKRQVLQPFGISYSSRWLSYELYNLSLSTASALYKPIKDDWFSFIVERVSTIGFNRVGHQWTIWLCNGNVYGFYKKAVNDIWLKTFLTSIIRQTSRWRTAKVAIAAGRSSLLQWILTDMYKNNIDAFLKLDQLLTTAT